MPGGRTPRGPRRSRRSRRAGTPPRPRSLPARLGSRSKFWLTLGPRTLFGDGKAELLDSVGRLGSLRRAAQRMGMSYRHAWGLLREMDRAAGFAFLERGVGEARTRLRLTPEARDFLAAWRAFRAPLDALVERRFRAVFARRR